MVNSMESCDYDFVDESVDKYEKAIEIAEIGPELGQSKKHFKLEMAKSLSSPSKVPEVDHLFFTNPREVMVKTIVQSLNHTFHKEFTGTPKNNSQSKGIESMIKKREGEIESIVVHAQCRSLEEAMNTYNRVDSQNDDLLTEIAHLDENINYVEEEIERLVRQKRSS
jgi:hypothetical protein